MINNIDSFTKEVDKIYLLECMTFDKSGRFRSTTNTSFTKYCAHEVRLCDRFGSLFDKDIDQ